MNCQAWFLGFWLDFAGDLDFFVVPTESGFHVSFSSVSGVECFFGFFDLECFVSFAGSSATAPCSNLKDVWVRLCLINVFLY